MLDGVRQRTAELNSFLEYDIGKRRSLNNFGNKVSIVFHNMEETTNGRNLLFTGDVNRAAWRCIEGKKTTIPLSLRMHKKYDIIKIPHHGTKYYYHSFVTYVKKENMTTFLIPNGDILRSPIYVGGLKNYRNDADEANVITSNNTSCSTWPSKTGAYRITVASKTYRRV